MREHQPVKDFFDHQRGDRPGGISVASAWLLKYPANVGSWHIAAVRGNAALRSLSERLAALAEIGFE